MSISNATRVPSGIDASADRHPRASIRARPARHSIAHIALGASLIASLPCHPLEANEPEAAIAGRAQQAPAEAVTGPSVLLSLEGNRLSAKLFKAPLRAVLARLAQETRIKVFVANTVPDDPISDAFDRLPLDASIKRLLANRGYALRYAQAQGANGSADGQPGIVELYVVPSASGDTQPYAMEPVGQTAEPGLGPSPAQTPAAAENADSALLARALGSESAADRIAALEKYLNEAERPDYQSVAKALKDPNRKVRELALGGMEDSNTLPVEATAEVALTDGEPALRKRALEILVERKGGAVRTALAQALEDPDPSVRAHAQEMAKLADKIDAFRARRTAQAPR